MSQQQKLEQILDCLINEDAKKAESMLHELVVEKARTIYESLVNDEDAEDEAFDAEESETVEEAIGGDQSEDFINNVSNDESDIEADELHDGEIDAEIDAEGEESEDSELEEIGNMLDTLVAKFNDVLNGEAGAADDESEFEGDFEADAEFDAEDDFGAEDDIEADVENMYEATKLQDQVADVPNQEGKLVGTGKNSKVGATGKDAPYTNAPSKHLDGPDSVDFTGEENTSGSAEKAKDETPGDNINAKHSAVSAGEQKAEGEFVGTGKNSKKGAVNTSSPMSKEPR